MWKVVWGRALGIKRCQIDSKRTAEIKKKEMSYGANYNSLKYCVSMDV